MSRSKMLRAFVNQRLTAAAEEIFEVFERTIAEYEEELYRSKENHRKILDAVFNPEVRLHRADVQQLLERKEDFPPEQQESPSLNQEDPTKSQLIKTEVEELSINQEGQQLQELEEATFTFTSVPVKSEKKPQSSQHHHTQTEENSDAEKHRNFNPDSHLQPVTHDKTLHSESETEDSSCDWEETSEPQSALNPLNNNEDHGGDMKCNSVKTLNISSECATSFGQDNLTDQKEVKPFSCSVCGNRYILKTSLTTHMNLHTEGKYFSCSVCKKMFPARAELVTHMRVHTGEKPFTCSVCGSKFARSSTLSSHMRVHTGEKPFTCSVCKTSFTRSNYLVSHMRIHTGERPFSCSVCGKRFSQLRHMRRHLSVHTGEKPFSCSICGQKFAHRGSLRRHMTAHTVKKTFRCSACGRKNCTSCTRGDT